MLSETTAPPRREHDATLPIGYVDRDGVAHRKVVLRKMTGREEAILADRRFQRNGGKLVTELLHSCILRIGEDEQITRAAVSSLYSADRNYLLLRLRSITFGPELDATYTCPTCGAVTAVTEDIDSLPVVEADDGAEVRIELEDGYIDRDGSLHTTMVLRLPTGADEEAVASQMRDNASTGKNALLARCVQRLGDLAPHRLDAMGPKIMADLTMTDRRLIDRALNSEAPGVDLVRHLDCDACGRAFTASLDLSNFLSLA